MKLAFLSSSLAKAILMFSLLAPACGFAACSRTMQVPVAPIGYSIILNGDAVSGIYADILQEVKKDGCQFNFTPVPRARLELMFESGSADLLLPSTRTPRRDELGIFVPMIKSRATVISLAASHLDFKTAQDLIARKDLRLVLVRGYDFGPAYQSLVAELTQQGRVFLEPDALSVARMLKTSSNYLTIMAPSIFVGAITEDPRVKDMLDKLSFTPLNELPWGESGIYISKTSLNKDDKEFLQNALIRAAKSGVVWKSSQRYYSADLLKESIRPLDATR